MPVLTRATGALLLMLTTAAAAAAQTLTVDRLDDPRPVPGACTLAPNDCSLRGAVQAAVAGTGAATVSLPAGTVRLDNGAIVILRGTITIDGAGADTSIVARASGVGRIFTLRRASTVTLRDLTLQDGVEPAINGAGGCLFVDGSARLINVAIRGCEAAFGGGVFHEGFTLTLDQSTVDANTAHESGGGIYSGIGNVLLHGSTVSRNMALGARGGGGGISARGLVLHNSTIAENRATNVGGGVYQADPSCHESGELRNATIIGNHARAGGGIDSCSSIMVNSIIADNHATAAPDCRFQLANGGDSRGYLLIGTPQDCPNYAPAATDIAAVNPQLDRLVSYGLPESAAPLRGSPVIAAGSPEPVDSSETACLQVDQRGRRRPEDGRCDIGATEFVAVPDASFRLLATTVLDGVRKAPFTRAGEVEVDRARELWVTSTNPVRDDDGVCCVNASSGMMHTAVTAHRWPASPTVRSLATLTNMRVASGDKRHESEAELVQRFRVDAPPGVTTATIRVSAAVSGDLMVTYGDRCPDAIGPCRAPEPGDLEATVSAAYRIETGSRTIRIFNARARFTHFGTHDDFVAQGDWIASDFTALPPAADPSITQAGRHVAISRDVDALVPVGSIIGLGVLLTTSAEVAKDMMATVTADFARSASVTFTVSPADPNGSRITLVPVDNHDNTLPPWVARPDDADVDGVAAARDTCPADFNPNQEDADGDGVGDACESPTIGGRIVDPYRTPVAGVTVRAVRPDGTVSQTQTDANGVYRFTNLPARMTLSIAPERSGFRFTPARQVIALAAREAEAASFTMDETGYRRYFAEGALGGFFDTSFALLNVTGRPTTATLTFQGADGRVVRHDVPLAGVQRATVDPETIGVALADFATVIAASEPLVVDRTMRWDRESYGSHAETSVALPRARWFFAEGATTGPFDLFYLLQNPSTQEAHVEIRYLRPSPLPPIVKNYVVGATSRLTIHVNDADPELNDAEVSAVIASTNGVRIIAERAMYTSTTTRTFDAGHESTAIAEPAIEWFFAEGATGPFFNLFLLVANPSDEEAELEFRYLLPDGRVVVKTHTTGPNSRLTIGVHDEDPLLAQTSVSTIVRSIRGIPVLAERAMWWPAASVWQEGHSSAGSTTTGRLWALAEGEDGGARHDQTFILIANTGREAATVSVRLVFEDATTSERSYTLPANSRFTVPVGTEFPDAVNRRFGAIVESLGRDPQPIVVDRAQYNDAGGVTWAAGSNALATRLR